MKLKAKIKINSLCLNFKRGKPMVNLHPPASCPLPQMSTASSGPAIAMAARMAKYRSTIT